MSTQQMSTEKPRTFIRFDLSARIEHILLIISFGMLCLTGLPQKFHNYAWAQTLMNGMGGIKTVQTMHHFFAYMMGIETVYHVLALIRSIFIKKSPNRFSMIPGLKDITDALRHLGYNLGLVKELPKYDRFNWKEKVEYWALVWGTLVMFLTGAILMWPEIITRWLPGYFIPAAKAAHGGEALLAFLAILVWHMYNAHLAQGKMPLDTTIFTGKVSEERMRHEYPLEYERILAREKKAEAKKA
ncbi:MAG: cytochrome C [Chloroflexi bacterium]|nr:cytochrome C [Chloroflexota bacterium]